MRSAAEILIEAQSSGAALTGNEAIVVLADGDGTPRVWLGHQQDGAPSAYFEVEVPRDLNFSVSQVISVRALQVEDESSTGMTIPVVKLTCHDRKLDRVFCAFVDELRERIHDGANVVAVIHASASDWRSLLQVAAISLSENAAAGIYGELRLLEAIVAELGAGAASMWQRSPREMHDFIGLGARIEVKTSAFQNRAAVTIHGLRQLEPPETGTLTLAVAEVQKHGGETIDTVVNRLRDRGVDGQAPHGETARLRLRRGNAGLRRIRFRVAVVALLGGHAAICSSQPLCGSGGDLRRRVITVLLAQPERSRRC